MSSEPSGEALERIKQWSRHVEPQLSPIKTGWAAHGVGWAVHGVTQEEAIRKYLGAELLYRQIDERAQKASFHEVVTSIDWHEVARRELEK